MVALFEGNVPSMPDERRGDDEMDSSYSSWLRSNPAAGEVFVETGEASAAASRKLRWSPTKLQQDLIWRAIEAETVGVNELYKDDSHAEYTKRVGLLAEEKLRGAGIDPKTFKPLSNPETSGSGGSDS